MSTCFDLWEKDPFFSAAEEVQESTDRMESVYRQWIHEVKHASDPNVSSPSCSAEVRRELRTTLGTAKWQLEEFEKAVTSYDEACSAGKETRTRHSQFIVAIGSRISMVENALKEASFEGNSTMSWVRLDEGERDELALFLSCPSVEQEKAQSAPQVSKVVIKDSPLLLGMTAEGIPDLSKKEGRVHGHRRTASASADIEAWKISVTRTEDERPSRPPPKIPSFSCLNKVAESTLKMKWPKNGFRKWKGGDQLQPEESIPLRNHQLSRGLDACYERTKSYLSDCTEDTYDKQLYGWVGSLHRQLQRSQYQIQYGRPMQMVFWAVLVVLLIVLFAFRAI
ncbi:uncharacterized protein LOC120252879 [Dioscorea cayenensis subsp. rotundata]|uniref:Uncharacterized protein LOC120252879 n=1 Tax=Dioscorea cayennensis subsp. rotundata TaxID=55577 RepID=A0AB40APX9_DIOCR|nr:uncharacterized protein LOC120252879 [Dioscorea cayenensis subsp. rotundata]